MSSGATFFSFAQAPERHWAGLLLEGDTRAVGWPLQNIEKEENFVKKVIAMNQQRKS